MPVGPGSGFVLGVLSILQPEPRFHFPPHKRAVLTSWNAYVFLLVVVCHGGDLLKAAQLESSVCIMETCLSRHPWINQLDVSPPWIVVRHWSESVNVKTDSRLWLSEQLSLRRPMSETQPTWLFFGHIWTRCLSAFNMCMCVLQFADISGILHVSHRLSIFRKNKLIMH